MRLTICALAVAACGTSSTTDRNRPGTGSSTLLVTGDVTASLTSGNQVTSFQVDLRDGSNNKVSGATVTIHNDDLGDVPLVEATAGSGRYVNSKASFPNADFSLTVTRNADNVQGVVAGNPGSFAINAPTNGAMVTANAPLAVSWTTPSTAKQATIKTKGLNVQVPDSGSYSIAAADNPAQSNQHLDLSRFNEVDIAGGLAGSRLRVTYTAAVDSYTVQ